MVVSRLEMVLKSLISDVDEKSETVMNNLTKVKLNTVQTIKAIHTKDVAMRDFLFTLGCYEGQTITVISKLSSTYVVNINDARYSIDDELAKAIIV